MRIFDIMDSTVGTISANDYAIEALRMMIKQKCPWIFVLESNELAGVIYARDLERYSETVLRDRDVREYLVSNVGTIEADTDIQEAERLLRNSTRGFLAVIKDGRPIGMLTPKCLVLPGRKFNLQAS